MAKKTIGIKKAEDVLKESQDQYLEAQEEINDFYSAIYNNDEKTKKKQEQKYQQLLDTASKADYFRSEHIDNLKLPYETCIVLTSKNSGKTWEQYRKFRECIEKGEKFIYMRVMKSELQISRTQFEVDEECPCVMVESQRRFFIYKKSDYDVICEKEMEKGKLKPWPSRVLFKRYGIDFVGYGIDFMNCNSIGGETFENFRYIFFDECLTHNPNNLVTFDHCKIFDKFLSSVVRSKDSLKVFMYGNLTHKNNCLLEHYGINKFDKFRYMLRDQETKAYLLFVNLGGVYRGSFKSQAGITKTGSIESIIENSTNKILNSYPRIVELDKCDELEDYFYWLFSCPGTETDIFVLKAQCFYTEENLSPVINYFVNIKKTCPILLHVLYGKKQLYTAETKLSQYNNCTYCPDINKRFKRLFRLYKTHELFFNSEEALTLFDIIYNKTLDKNKESYKFNF